MNPSDLLIRPVNQGDIEALGELSFPWSSKQETQYFEEHTKGLRISLIAEWKSQIAGYGHLLLDSAYPSFRENHMPEIHDVRVYEEIRKQGIGAALITYLEALAKKQDYLEIGIGVGLYSDYGSAQRLYARLGYQPNRKGITYKTAPVVPGQSYPVDDELILWLKKQLPS